MRVLVAAFGNELRRDDGFGIAVLRELEAAGLGARDTGVRLLEVGTGGIGLAQELLSPWDRLIIVDAMHRGSPAGTVSVLRVDDVPDPTEVDLHLAVPGRVLSLAKALGVLPRETYLVGCEPADVDELSMELSEPVRRAVATASRQVRRLVEQQT